MKLAADFRQLAQNALRGKWPIAVLACIIATMLGGVGGYGPEINFNIDGGQNNISVDYNGTTIISNQGGLNPELEMMIFGGAIYLLILALVMSVLYFVLSSVVTVGYARFNLEIVDDAEPTINSLFAYLAHWKTTAVAQLLQMVYIFLWTLLFVIPGVMASYSYALTKYILAEEPELSAGEALRKSKELMDGNRWRLFCLHISFIGWHILSAFTLGIANLFLTPYIETSVAAFYREVTDTWVSEPTFTATADEDEYYYSDEDEEE